MVSSFPQTPHARLSVSPINVKYACVKATPNQRRHKSEASRRGSPNGGRSSRYGFNSCSHVCLMLGELHTVGERLRARCRSCLAAPVLQSGIGKLRALGTWWVRYYSAVGLQNLSLAALL